MAFVIVKLLLLIRVKCLVLREGGLVTELPQTEETDEIVLTLAGCQPLVSDLNPRAVWLGLGCCDCLGVLFGNVWFLKFSNHHFLPSLGF